MSVIELFNEYQELAVIKRKLEDKLYEFFHENEKTFYYNGVQVKVDYFDEDRNIVNICPYDGESILSSSGKNIPMTFKDFEEKVELR